MSDRGMMKWNAFNALLAHGSNVKKMMLERKKIDKPILSSDQIDDLNIKMQIAIEENREIEVAFYNKGFVLLAEGVIKRVDLINRLLVLPDIRIRLDDLLQIEFKEQ